MSRLSSRHLPPLALGNHLKDMLGQLLPKSWIEFWPDDEHKEEFGEADESQTQIEPDEDGICESPITLSGPGAASAVIDALHTPGRYASYATDGHCLEFGRAGDCDNIWTQLVLGGDGEGKFNGSDLYSGSGEGTANPSGRLRFVRVGDHVYVEQLSGRPWDRGFRAGRWRNNPFRNLDGTGYGREESSLFKGLRGCGKVELLAPGQRFLCRSDYAFQRTPRVVAGEDHTCETAEGDLLLTWFDRDVSAGQMEVYLYRVPEGQEYPYLTIESDSNYESDDNGNEDE